MYTNHADDPLLFKISKRFNIKLPAIVLMKRSGWMGKQDKGHLSLAKVTIWAELSNRKLRLLKVTLEFYVFKIDQIPSLGLHSASYL